MLHSILIIVVFIVQRYATPANVSAQNCNVVFSSNIQSYNKRCNKNMTFVQQLSFGFDTRCMIECKDES